MEFKPAICPICGGRLSLPDDENIVKVKCLYCGNDIIVREAIQKAIGPTIENYLSIAKTAEDAGNYSEAYKYYNKILELDAENYEAWFGKGISAGWQSTVADNRLPETITAFANALKYAPVDKKEDIKNRSAALITLISTSYWKLVNDHVYKFGSNDETRERYLTRCIEIIEALETAHMLAPQEKQIIQIIIDVCKGLIEGTSYTDFDEYGETLRTLRLSPQFEAQLKSKMNEYIEKMKALDSSYQPPQIKKKGCFIITATLGNDMHPSVVLLREFRDRWLSKKAVGKKFIEKYYRYSPFFANLIRERKRLRWVSYNFIVKPSVRLATKLLRGQAKNT